VAINKIDKPEAQPERVKRQLSDLGLMPAEWGGETEFVEVSAKQKKNLDKLLEIILLVADLRELKANPDAPASGTVLEIAGGQGPRPGGPLCWCRNGYAQQRRTFSLSVRYSARCAPCSTIAGAR